MEPARVIKMVGVGESALRQAITSGVLTVEARRMAERVLADNERLKRENSRLRRENGALDALCARYRAMENDLISSYVNGQSGAQRRRDWHLTLTVTLLSAGAMAAMLLTVGTLL